VARGRVRCAAPSARGRRRPVRVTHTARGCPVLPNSPLAALRSRAPALAGAAARVAALASCLFCLLFSYTVRPTCGVAHAPAGSVADGAQSQSPFGREIKEIDSRSPDPSPDLHTSA
jgi:hypothetical protein